MHQQPHRNHTILVVEDDAIIGYTLTEVLEDEGYQVVPAMNGEEALAYLRSHPAPCLILLDLMMPVMNGWEFRMIQRADPRLCDIPIIVLSARTTPQEYDRLRTLDAAAYVDKPIDLHQLLTIVGDLCDV